VLAAATGGPGARWRRRMAPVQATLQGPRPSVWPAMSAQLPDGRAGASESAAGLAGPIHFYPGSRQTRKLRQPAGACSIVALPAGRTSASGRLPPKVAAGEQARLVRATSGQRRSRPSPAAWGCDSGSFKVMDRPARLPAPDGDTSVPIAANR